MRALKLWLDRSPAAQAVLVFTLAMVMNLLFRQDWHFGWWVLRAGVLTAVVMGVVAAQRRRTVRVAGIGPRKIADLNRKIRHREVPEDPEERATMGRLVAEQLGKMERGGRWLPYWLGSMGLVAVGLIVLGAVSGSLTAPLVFAVGTVGLCSWVLRTRRRSMELHRHMRSALRNPG
ncbi:MAG TPA: hypothetical protein VN520_14035 [Streptomyces sp.]|uniref:hypothetical protein n=1 Tax=Streptomyces sp. TaxID=1931 RepID=UPI002D150DDD|nr:hypothetical protein [Streptomyces sp.]HWU07476.1 hypothetical protein [Streptomyces sp.]